MIRIFEGQNPESKNTSDKKKKFLNINKDTSLTHSSFSPDEAYGLIDQSTTSFFCPNSEVILPGMRQQDNSVG
jgi:hypothetical protein